MTDYKFNGSIPTDMLAYLQPETSLSKLYPSMISPMYKDITVSPAFIVPATSEAFKKSALDWACGGGFGYVQIQKPEKVRIVPVKNEPFSGLRWVQIDERAEGGRAYKVVTSQGFLVDMREDVVLECLRSGKISGTMLIGGRGAGVYLNEEFVWAQLGSQMRLVVVGSKMHQDLVESDQRKNTELITFSQIEVGGIYMDRRGKKHIVLDKQDKPKKIMIMQLGGWYGQGKASSPQQEYEWSVQIIDKGAKNHLPLWGVSGSANFIEKTGAVNVRPGLLADYTKKCKQYGMGK
jgi:hypothetical protein